MVEMDDPGGGGLGGCSAAMTCDPAKRTGLPPRLHATRQGLGRVASRPSTPRPHCSIWSAHAELAPAPQLQSILATSCQMEGFFTAPSAAAWVSMLASLGGSTDR